MLSTKQSQRKYNSYLNFIRRKTAGQNQQMTISILDRVSSKLNRNSVQVLVGNTRRLLALSWKMILIPFVAVLVVFLGIFSQRYNLPFSPNKLTKDPMAMAKLPFFYGLFSNLGIMLWVSAATVNFFGAMLLRSNHTKFRFMIFPEFLLFG